MNAEVSPHNPGKVPEPAQVALSPAPRLWAALEHEFWLALALAALIVCLALGLDWFLLRAERWRPMAMAAISDAIFGVIAFVLLLLLLRYARQRRRQVMRRLEVIDQMNHHIRNALQVISFNARLTSRNEWELGEIRQAVNRIHWTLREILPKVEPEFVPFEGPAREPEGKGKASTEQ